MATDQTTLPLDEHELDPAIRWLLAGDPAIRWQTLRDLTTAPAAEIAARARVATEGWGAHLLELQADDGTWGGVAFNQGCDSTMHVLMLLRDFGLDPASDPAQRALGLVRDNVTWEWWNTAFFTGEEEPCINGQVAAAGAYFGQDVRGIIDRLLGEQLADGGWNCDSQHGATRSSFNTTICVLEALLAWEQRVGTDPRVSAVRQRGEAYLLERHLFRRKSTGEPITRDRKGGADWTEFAYPTWWHYDVLRGLEYFRAIGAAPAPHLADAITLVESKRDASGRWSLDARYPGTMPIDFGEELGQPSRWITLRARRVLRWFSGED